MAYRVETAGADLWRAVSHDDVEFYFGTSRSAEIFCDIQNAPGEHGDHIHRLYMLPDSKGTADSFVGFIHDCVYEANGDSDLSQVSDVELLAAAVKLTFDGPII